MAKILNDIELKRLLGMRLKAIDQQFKTVTQGYADIDDAIRRLNMGIQGIRETLARTPDTVREVLRVEVRALQNRWLIAFGSILISTVGLFIALLSSEVALAAFGHHGPLIGLGMMIVGPLALAIISRQK